MPSPTPCFSVIVPVFNAGQSLPATVASVLAQTDDDFELYLIDDGSTDDSLNVMLALGMQDQRIQVVSKSNEGVAATRNFGAGLAQGALLAFLDADDAWLPTKLARHRAHHAAHPGNGVSYGRIAFVEANRGRRAPQTQSTVPAGALSVAQLIGENPVCTASNVVTTRDCFAASGGFDVTMRYAEDQEWLARVAASGTAIIGIDALLVEYRLSPHGLSTDLGAMYAGWRQIAESHRGSIDVAAAEAVFCRYLARRALRLGRSPSDALRFALNGLSHDASAFLADRRRGGLTLAAALISPALPSAVRARVFA